LRARRKVERIWNLCALIWEIYHSRSGRRGNLLTQDDCIPSIGNLTKLHELLENRIITGFKGGGPCAVEALLLQ
jgi:hypothetical protein